MHVLIWIVWALTELLLIKAFINPIRMVMDRDRHYQNWEFNGAFADSIAIFVAAILVGALTFLATA